MKNENKLSPV